MIEVLNRFKFRKNSKTKKISIYSSDPTPPPIPSSRSSLPGRFLRLSSRGCGFLLIVFVSLFIIEWIRLPDLNQLLRSKSSSLIITDRWGEFIDLTLTPDDRLAMWVSLEEIHPKVIEATLTAEDQRFYDHGGVDLQAVSRAAYDNLSNQRIISGASTVTMQLARLLRPLPRSFYGKFREMVLALHIENNWDKETILEYYLNFAPYGGNVYGVEAASRRYFGKSAKELTLSEAALISGLPQSPSRLRPDRYPQAAKKRRDWILMRLYELKKVTQAQYERSLQREVRPRFHSIDKTAPHFSRWLASKMPRISNQANIHSTLDPDLQTLAQSVLSEELERMSSDGIQNTALILAETQSGKIRAWIGSQDFNDPEAGQVDGAISERSPGSLLKPFLFTLAFEKNWIDENTLLDDSPRYYRDGYRPENFSRSFKGKVTASEALRDSLNIPTLDLLKSMGLGEVIEKLKDSGLVSLRKNAQLSGLTLGLGGVDVTLYELMEAYRTLGNGGVYSPLVATESSLQKSTHDSRTQSKSRITLSPNHRVFSQEAVEKVTSILQEVGFSTQERLAPLKLPDLAIKTGTSFGLRDAWAVGYNQDWTIGVWLGNFDGSASKELVGRKAAVPSILSLFRLLPELNSKRSSTPSNLASTSKDNQSLNLNSLTTPKAPYFSPKESFNNPSTPSIQWVTPPHRATILHTQREGGDKLILRGTSSIPEIKLNWFIDGSYQGQTRSGENLSWLLKSGAHTITLSTNTGHTETRTIFVK